MRKNKNQIIMLLMLLVGVVCVAVLFGVNLKTRRNIPSNTLSFETENSVRYLDIEKLKTEPISGQVKNGNGRISRIEGRGILLRDLIGECEYTQVEVISDDEYRARLDASEIRDEDKVYIIVEENKARLCVFGDNDSKRNVVDVKRIVTTTGNE